MSRAKQTWMQRHVTDPFVRKAQEDGYRSRAAYKLLDLAVRDRLITPGMTLVDLGSAPGGWCQVAAAMLGGRGRLIALDLLPMEPVPGVVFIQADFREPEGLAQLEAALQGGSADLVMSDMAPNLSGIAATDQARSLLLGELAVEFAKAWLKPQGSLLVKAFHGSAFNELRRLMGQTFTQVAARKPAASRDSSAETYLLGRGLRATPQDASPISAYN